MNEPSSNRVGLEGIYTLMSTQGDHHSRTLAHHSRTEKNSQDMFFLGGIVIFIRYNGTSF